MGIGLIRKQMGMDRWNPDREDAPQEFKNQEKTEESVEKPAKAEKKTTKKAKAEKAEEPEIAQNEE